MSGRFIPRRGELDFLVRRPIAHRGLHDRTLGVVENSASAFAAAITHKYAIECDLQLTADGEAVVFHDERLDRLTESTGWVHERTAAQMKAFVLRGTQDRAQTLAELLHQVHGQVPLVIEIKTHWKRDHRLAWRALEVLRGYDGPHCLMSFDPDVVEALRLRSPQTLRGIVADRTVDPEYNLLPLARRIELRAMSHFSRTVPEMGRTQPHFISYHFRDLPWAPVTAFRHAGHPVISWTIRSAEQAAQARRYSDQITFEGFHA